MKFILGILLILAGIALGLYVGLWLMLIGGIIQFVNAVKADPVETSGVAWGVARVFLASTAGGLIVWLIVAMGVGLLSSDDAPHRPTAKQVEGDYRRAMR